MMAAIFAIGGLNEEILSTSGVRFPIMDSMIRHNIASTIPPYPQTSWMTAWTGVNPSIHGYIPGLYTNRQNDLESVWDILQERHLKVANYTELDAAGPEDIYFYQTDEVGDMIKTHQIDDASKLLGEISSFIKELTCPVLIISAYGTTQYKTAFSVDKYLMARGLLMLDETKVDKKETIAYPVNMNGHFPSDTYGIKVNSARRRGILSEDYAIQIQGEILTQLNKVTGVDAVSAHQVYDLAGENFGSCPDIVLRSPSGMTYFRNMGDMRASVIEPYADIELSSVGLIAANRGSCIDIGHIDCVSKVRLAIDKLLATEGADE